MFFRIQLALLASLGLFLPLHGALTVFGPDWLRWWKEVFLGLLVLSVIPNLFPRQKTLTKWRLNSKKLHVRLFLFNPIFYALLFLVWGGFLVLFNQDIHTALVAYRYLGLGFYALLLGYGLWKTQLFSAKNGYTNALKLFHIFCTSLTLGVLISTVFGLWAKLAGGYEVLTAWYSDTISSWVPGQTLPLYHQVGDFVRLQGTSSGPVEYAHLAVLALWYVLFFEFKITNSERRARRNNWWSKICLLPTTYYVLPTVLLLILGIYHSGSRAALVGVVLLFGLKVYQKYLKPRLEGLCWTADKLAGLLLVMIVATAMLKFTVSKSILGNTEFLQTPISSPLKRGIIRISDADHLSRPLQALNLAIDSPLLGNLGGLGPAARAKNLRENNNDQAPIAESVPFDVLAQLGFLGFIFWLLTFVGVWFWAGKNIRVLLLVFAPLMLLATLFDMTPLSISFFLIVGLGLVLPKIRVATKADQAMVFNLKQLAFKPYVEKVWGWQQREQERFVKQELGLGGVELLFLEGQPQATFSLVQEPQGLQLYSFYVHPEFQSQGLGRYLLQSESPSRAVCLAVLKVNPRAKAFYDAHQFLVVGEDEHHWHLKKA